MRSSFRRDIRLGILNFLFFLALEFLDVTIIWVISMGEIGIWGNSSLEVPPVMTLISNLCINSLDFSYWNELSFLILVSRIRVP